MEGVSGPGLVFLPRAGLLLCPHLPPHLQDGPFHVLQGALPPRHRALPPPKLPFPLAGPQGQRPRLLQQPGPVALNTRGELRPWRPGVRARPSPAVATLVQLVLVHALQMLPEGRGAHVNPRAAAHLPATQAAGGILVGVVPGAGRGQVEVPPGLGKPSALAVGQRGGRGAGEGAGRLCRFADLPLLLHLQAPFGLHPVPGLVLLFPPHPVPSLQRSLSRKSLEPNRAREAPGWRGLQQRPRRCGDFPPFCSTGVRRIFTCSLRNVFPTANLTWFIQRSVPQAEIEEMYTASEKRKDKDGFWELKSVLTSVYDNKAAHSNTLTIWCMALSPAPGHKVWNSSSEKITFSLGSVNPPTDSPLNATESTLGTQPSPANSISPTASNSNVPTRGFNYSWTSSGKDAKLSPWMPSETNSSPSPDAGSTLPGDIFTSTTRASSEVPTTANVSTKNNHIHITGIVISKPKDGMSWPVIVAALLSSCLVLFGLGVRKWCQYQKEIMERPPPFKPPPPPIKYTCIQESIGSDVPCHELETL
ncbi:T-cell surface protein tactile isoform X2 [Odocoileus virginianus]|uniref:T-cell surface protein tactile isoform X2 n=1 Tax=Odocoileus virginianus TaxID=9874 RepID=A0ABM4H622_ODOVR